MLAPGQPVQKDVYTMMYTVSPMCAKAERRSTGRNIGRRHAILPPRSSQCFILPATGVSDIKKSAIIPCVWENFDSGYPAHQALTLTSSSGEGLTARCLLTVTG